MLISLRVGNSQGIIKHFLIIRVKIMRTCSFGIRQFLICWWLNLHTTSSFENRVEVQHCLFVFLFQSKMLVCLQRKRIKKWECNERNNLKRKKVCTLKTKIVLRDGVCWVRDVRLYLLHSRLWIREKNYLFRCMYNDQHLIVATHLKQC